jgi:hypothetical protein
MGKQARVRKKQKQVDKQFLDIIDANIKKDKKLLERLSKA